MVRLHGSQLRTVNNTHIWHWYMQTRLHHIIGRGVLRPKYLTYRTISMAAYLVERSSKLIPYASPLYTTQILPPPSPAYLLMPNSDPEDLGGAVCCYMFLRNNEIFF